MLVLVLVLVLVLLMMLLVLVRMLPPSRSATGHISSRASMASQVVLPSRQMAVTHLAGLGCQVAADAGFEL